MKYNEIGKTGMKVSELSFGASSLGGVFHSIKEDKAIEAVFTAIETGMNFIDVSPYYGHYKAETVLGKALKEIPRDKYYLSTKVGRYGKGMEYMVLEKIVDILAGYDIDLGGNQPVILYPSTGVKGIDYNIDIEGECYKDLKVVLLVFKGILYQMGEEG